MTQRSLIIGVVSAVAFVLLGGTAAFGDIQALTVNDKAQLTSNPARAVVSGFVACDQGEDGSVTVFLQQAQGRDSVFGLGVAEVACDGTLRAFAVTVQSEDHAAYKHGPASARVQASSSTPFNPENPELFHGDDRILTTTVHLGR